MGEYDWGAGVANSQLSTVSLDLASLSVGGLIAGSRVMVIHWGIHRSQGGLGLAAVTTISRRRGSDGRLGPVMSTTVYGSLSPIW